MKTLCLLVALVVLGLQVAAQNENALTIDDVRASWMEWVGKTVTVRISTRSDINQLGPDLWEVNLWHKGHNLYSQFGKKQFEEMKRIWTENSTDSAGVYLVGTIKETTVENQFGKQSKAPCLVVTSRTR